ncbi:hypothetical protein C9374_010774 [Naegleria lovaniensis]|uniref:Uncharacterized protein n=1 Tax=Naegleria lovaniensis TaxID=51637 RepID=A0AA88GB35_NAELO|nr:uncharacterized protein C9374_010774 [Naegleria lovaniensis]KAG2374490.1 hypothetical protein C9374_010774 [Naegleria lovaniensis]
MKTRPRRIQNNFLEFSSSSTLTITCCLFILLITLQSSLLAFHSNQISSFHLLHTDDLHSHFEGNGPDSSLTDGSVENGNNQVIGHYARLLTLIKKMKKTYSNVLLLDGGDWLMGTMFHTLSMSSMFPELAPPELEFFRIAGYDAITMGNHEFDVFQEGVLSIIRRMNSQSHNDKYALPIVSSNLITNLNELQSSGGNYNLQECEQFWNDLIRDPYHIHPNNGNAEKSREPKHQHEGTFFTPYMTKTFKSENGTELTVGVIGTMGPAAAMTAMTGRQPCFHYYGFNETTKKVDIDRYVNSIYHLALDLKLGRNGSPKCHVVVVLSHSGEPEDKEVAEIIVKKHKTEYSKKQNEHLPRVAVDVHISSHSHNIYFEKLSFTSRRRDDKNQHDIQHDVYIHQAGPYASNLGVLQFDYIFETEQLILKNEKIKVPKSTLISDSVTRDAYERDHLGDINNPISLFHTTGVCFDCIDHENVLLPIRIPITNEIPMDQDYLKILQNYKHLINKYILGAEFPFQYESWIGSIDISNITEKTQFGDVAADCIVHEMRHNQQKIKHVLEQLKQQVSNYNPEWTLSQVVALYQSQSQKNSKPLDKYHYRFNHWRLKDIENVVNNRFDVYLIPTDGFRTHIVSLKHWNESIIPLQFSDIYNMLPLGRLKHNIREGILPGESIEIFYLPFRTAKRLLTYSFVIGEVMGFHFLSMCRSTNLSYKTRWYGIPLLVEDKIDAKEERELSWFWKLLRKVKNSLARYYDFEVDGFSENEYRDRYFASESHVYSEDALLGMMIPGWMVNFMSKTATFTGGFLSLEMRDRYGRVLVIPHTNTGVPDATVQVNSKLESKTLYQTTISATPFLDYQIVAECLASQRKH